MKKKVTQHFMLLAGLILFSLQVSALPVDTLYVGLCNGQSSTENKLVFTDAKPVSACIKLSEKDVSHYIGNNLSAIRFALVSKLKMDSLTVWVRTSLSGNNIASGKVDKAELQKGWNLAKLNTPVLLGSNQSYYIGYTYYQSGTCYAISSIGADQDNGLLVREGNADWTDASRKGYGVLSIEGAVVGNKLPQYDARIQTIELSKDSVKIGTPLCINGVIFNNASQPFNRFKLQCTSEGIEPFEVSVQTDSTINYRQAARFNLTFTPRFTADKENIPIEVKLLSLDDHEDEDADNSISNLDYAAFLHLIQRNLLIEDFTTEHCVYCPQAGERLATILAEHPQHRHLIATSHHTGFGEDSFTIQASRDYLALFGSTDQYSPAFMFDRDKFNSDRSIIYSFGNYDDMYNTVTYFQNIPATVDVNTYAYFNDSKDSLIVDVCGEKTADYNATDSRITVYLVENNVPAEAQRGKDGKPIANYIHQHMIRQVSKVWGDSISFNGNEYSYQTKLALNRKDAKLENLYVVAFISNYNKDKVTDRKIMNADKFDLLNVGSKQPTGIATITADKNDDINVHLSGKNVAVEGACSSFRVYDINGCLVKNENLLPGFYLVSVQLLSGKQITKKIIINY